MKCFQMVRANKVTNIVEFSLWDMVKLMFGREIEIIAQNSILIRHHHSYNLFNLSAPKVMRDV